jgi:general stress protein YciG
MAGKSHRGFGAMEKEKQRQIASKGGKAAHQKGTAHEFTPEEARAAGRKGGQAAHQKGTAHQFTPQEAAAAGRKGGRAAHHRSVGSRAPSQERPNQLPNGSVSQGAEPVHSGTGHMGGPSPGPAMPRPVEQEIMPGGMNTGTTPQESNPEPREETLCISPAQP